MPSCWSEETLAMLRTPYGPPPYSKVRTEYTIKSTQDVDELAATLCEFPWLILHATSLMIEAADGKSLWVTYAARRLAPLLPNLRRLVLRKIVFGWRAGPEPEYPFGPDVELMWDFEGIEALEFFGCEFLDVSGLATFAEGFPHLRFLKLDQTFLKRGRGFDAPDFSHALAVNALHFGRGLDLRTLKNWIYDSPTFEQMMLRELTFSEVREEDLPYVEVMVRKAAPCLEKLTVGCRFQIDLSPRAYHLPLPMLRALRHLQIRILDLWQDAAYWVPMMLRQAQYLSLENLVLEVWLYTKFQLECQSANDICCALYDLLLQSSKTLNVVIVYRGTMDFARAEEAILDRFGFCDGFPDCNLSVVQGDYFYKKPLHIP